MRNCYGDFCPNLAHKTARGKLLWPEWETSQASDSFISYIKYCLYSEIFLWASEKNKKCFISVMLSSWSPLSALEIVWIGPHNIPLILVALISALWMERWEKLLDILRPELYKHQSPLLALFPQCYFLSLAIMCLYQQAGFFSFRMSSWTSWIKCLKIITRPELHRFQHYVTFKCCQGVLQRKLICSPVRPVCSKK